MKKILDKMRNEEILDSEIIQDIKNNFEFNINWIHMDDYCWSLLMDAVFYNRKELVEYFLADPDIDINYTNRFKFAALHFALRIHILKLLLSRKDLNVNVQNNSGWTALHFICFMGNKECVKELLLDARVDVMIRNKMGEMGRDCAIQNGNHMIANMLKMVQYTPLLRIPNRALCGDIIRMIIEEYV